MRMVYERGSFRLRRGAMAVGLALVLVPAGCSTTSVQETTPAARPAEAYPNLNIRPGAASAQLDEAERQRLVEELAALRQRQASAPAANQAALEAERLRLLARLHAERRLAEIEGAE